jgi:hypothetical protein
VPLVIWLPVNVPPDAPPETAAVQAVALAEVHFALTASPRLMVEEADGCEKLTVGAGTVGAGVVGAGVAEPPPYPPPLPPPPHPASPLMINPDAILPHVETCMAL